MLARPPPAGLTAPRPVCSPWLLLDDSGWIHRSSVVLKHALRGDLVKSWLRDRWAQSHTHWDAPCDSQRLSVWDSPVEQLATSVSALAIQPWRCSRVSGKLLGTTSPRSLAASTAACNCRRASENTSAALAMDPRVCGYMAASCWLVSVGGMPKGHPWTGGWPGPVRGPVRR